MGIFKGLKVMNSSYAKQTLDITRMRGMLEDETESKRREMLKAIQKENQLLVSF